MGARWGCLSQDRASRFVVAWAFAPTEEQAAPTVVRLTRERTRQQAGIPWISDGKRAYAKQVRKVYRDPERTGKIGRPPLRATPGVRLTQVVKQRIKGRVVGVTPRATIGQPVDGAAVVCEERLNGVLRDRLNCLTRKTHAFAKQTRTWEAAVTVCLFEHNWLRPHIALRQRQENLPAGRRYLRRTPAMAVGRTDHIWKWSEFLAFQVKHHKRE